MSAKVAETVEGLRRLASFIARGLLAPVGADATIENAIALLSDPASQVGRMREFLCEYDRLIGNYKYSEAHDLRDRVYRWMSENSAALAISPPVKCSCGMGDASAGLHADHCEMAIRPDCSQPKAAQVGGDDALVTDLIYAVRSHERSPDKYTAQEIDDCSNALIQRLRQSRDASNGSAQNQP